MKIKLLYIITLESAAVIKYRKIKPSSHYYTIIVSPICVTNLFSHQAGNEILKN